MPSEHEAMLKNRMIAETEDFITCHLKNGHIAWPRRAAPADNAARRRTEQGEVRYMNVLIVGELALEFPISVEATKAELLKLLRSKNRKRRIPWTFGNPSVGGFVGHATRLASELGANISVRAVLPVPIPACFELFLDTFKVNRQELQAVPGRCPTVLHVRCTDGHFSVSRSGVASTLSPIAADRALGYDLVVAAPGASAGRMRVIRSLTAIGRSGGGFRTVAFQVDDRWTQNDLKAMAHQPVWTFVDEDDVARLTRGSEASARDVASSGLVAFRNDFHLNKLVMTLGSRGAIMANGESHQYHVPTCPVDDKSASSCRPVLTATAAVSSAAGADDETSLRRAVVAATGMAAGLDLPQTLAELDVA